MPKVEDYIIKCNELGMPSIALTEHGNMRSALQLAKSAKGKFEIKKEIYAQGETFDLEPIKPIFGVEFYITPNDYTIKGLDESSRSFLKRTSDNVGDYKRAMKVLEDKQGIRTRYHVLVFAKNEIGFKNLLTLNYLSWKNGFYYRPRIDLDLLKKYSEGLIITSSCIGGWVPNLIREGDNDGAVQWIADIKKHIGDDFYIEIQPHDIDEQRTVNEMIIDLAEETKTRIIATNDCHYLNKGDWESHEVLLAIQSRKEMASNDRWRFDDREFYLKSKSEMIETFKRNHSNLSEDLIRKSLENTMEIYDKCEYDIKIDKKKGILPDVKVIIPSDYKHTAKDYILNLCKKGMRWRNIKRRAQDYGQAIGVSFDEAYAIYIDRLKMELNRIYRMKFENYFLVIWDLISWSRQQGILVGPGRGSSSGSLVCYLLGITSIDPIVYDLMFDRFLSENRIDYPDVDMDFEDARRHEVYEYLVDKYGEDNVCKIGTNGTMKGKAALLSVGKVFGVPISRTYEVNKHIVERSSGDARASQTVEDSFKEFDVCRTYSKEFPDVLKHVKILEGKVKQVGIHAAGVQIADRPIHEIVPIEYRTSDGTPYKVSGYDWRGCQEVGLIKLDLLGLSTLTTISYALSMIKEKYNKTIDLEQIDLESQEVLKGFTDTNFIGIFQFDSIGMTKTCEPLTFDRFDDVIALNALYRPGAMRSGEAQHYINRKMGKEKIAKVNKIYDRITKDTHGIVVYQEQLLKLFVELASFRPGKADEIRKVVSKSVGNQAILKEKVEFVNGAVKNGMVKKKAEELFENMAFFGSYAFNKAHAAAYSVISYWGMYLKTYYPVEFFYSLLKNESEHDEIIRFVAEARKVGIRVETPDINKSELSFSVTDDEEGQYIISGIEDIKGCGEKASVETVNNTPYFSIADFCRKVNRTRVNRGVIKSLVKANAFKSLYPNMKALLTELDLNKNNTKKKSKIMPVWEWMIDMDQDKGNKLYDKVSELVGEYNDEEQVSVLAEVCPIPSLKHKIRYYDWVDELVTQKITYVGDINYKQPRVIVKGILVDIKYNNVGDFHKEAPSDLEKERIGWGRRYANINIEDDTGIIRCNVDIHTFPSFRHIIDKGIGTPIMVYARMFEKSESLFCDIMVDLDEVKKKKLKYESKIDLFKSLSPYERYFLKHPVDMIPKDKIPMKARTVSKMKSTRSGTFLFQGLIIRTKEHWTKKNKKMMFMDIEDGTGVLNCILWPDVVSEHSHKLRQGNIIQCHIQKKKAKEYFFSGKKEVKKVLNVWHLIGSDNGEDAFEE